MTFGGSESCLVHGMGSLCVTWSMGVRWRSHLHSSPQDPSLMCTSYPLHNLQGLASSECTSSKIPGLRILLTVSHRRYPTRFITSPHMASQPGLPTGRVLEPSHRNPLIISGHFYLPVPSGFLTLNPHLPWFHQEGFQSLPPTAAPTCLTLAPLSRFCLIVLSIVRSCCTLVPSPTTTQAQPLGTVICLPMAPRLPLGTHHLQ